MRYGTEAEAEAMYRTWRGCEKAIDALFHDGAAWRAEMVRLRYAAAIDPEMARRYGRDGIQLDPWNVASVPATIHPNPPSHHWLAAALCALAVLLLAMLAGCASRQITFECAGCLERSDTQIAADSADCNYQLAQLAYMAPQRTPAMPYQSQPNSPWAAGSANILGMMVNQPPGREMFVQCMAARGWQVQ